MGLLFCLFSIYNAVIDLFTCRKKKERRKPLEVSLHMDRVSSSCEEKMVGKPSVGERR